VEQRPRPGVVVERAEPDADEVRIPGEDSYSVRRFRPATSRKCSARTDALVAKAVPFARRHCEQWQ